jgi:periplasmic divalent cation tolerance protein
MKGNTLLIFCTCPDLENAEQIAGHLVDNGLAACVNITAPVSSTYLWRNKRETSEEILLLIKSSRHRYPALEHAIVSLHPYELPEIIAVPVEQGLPGYLQWVDQCTTKNS